MNTRNDPVSFIIPCFNCADTLETSVRSILDGNFEEDDEIILVDDASDDRTGHLIEKLAGSHKKISFFRHRFRRGFANAGRNTGIDRAANELIFCLDADNLLFPGTLRPLVKHLKDTKADAAAFGQTHVFIGSPSRITEKWVFNETISLADALAGYYWPGPGGNYLFTRSAWLKAGRCFEPSLTNRAIDSWTFGIRLLGTGSKMVTLKDTYYLHRQGLDSQYMRERLIGNQSLTALSAILPFLDLLDEHDADYILSRQGRARWYEELSDRPIRVKASPPGRDGKMETVRPLTAWESWQFKLSRFSSRIPKALRLLRHGY